MSKYEPLRVFLQSTASDEVSMTFTQIEAVLGFGLPGKSKLSRAWWSNNPDNNVMTREWRMAGFRSAQVDIEAQQLVFKRIEPSASRRPVPAAKPSGRKRHPLFGALSGLVTFYPNVDLTEPAHSSWLEGSR